MALPLEPESFDLVICYGGALSYVCELRHKAAEELFRVTRTGGTLLASVMSRFGTLALIGRRQLVQIMEHPDAWNLSQVAELGDLAQFPSSKVSISQPPMHLYSAGEIKELLASVGFDVLEVAGSNVVSIEGSTRLEELVANENAWATTVELERMLNRRPGLLDSGSHIIVVARRPS